MQVPAARMDRRGGESPQLSRWEGYPILSPILERSVEMYHHNTENVLSATGEEAGAVRHWGKVS